MPQVYPHNHNHQTQTDSISSGGVSQDTLIESSQNISLHRTRNSLQRFMRLTLGIVVLHIIHRSESSLNRDIEALIAGVVEGFADGRGDDVRLAVLLQLDSFPKGAV